MGKFKLLSKNYPLIWFRNYLALAKWARIFFIFFVLLIAFLLYGLREVRKECLDLQRQVVLGDKEKKEVHEELLAEKARNLELAKDLEPFQQVAREQFPQLREELAMARLLQEFERTEKFVEQYEFTPLSEEKKNQIMASLRKINEAFGKKGVSIEITFETWVSSAVKRMAEELATLLSDAELNVTGPTLAVVYLEKPTFPLEWEYSESDAEFARNLDIALLPLMSANSKSVKRSTSSLYKKLKIHFAGQAKFTPEGTVTIY